MSIKVAELFAGVGGFRIGLEGYPRKKSSKYDVVWSNQWEPSTKTQHANKVYETRWPKANHCGENIEEVIENNFDSIPDHDMLVGGFPCQDYSVATTLRNSKGLRGKKGVLWWSIEAILRRKEDKKPKYLMLENVDRLLKSPAIQRGRDFAIMLSSLNSLGYAVEWRVINAAEYGLPQRRRRVFIMGYLKGTSEYNSLVSAKREEWMLHEGVIASAFPVKEEFIPAKFGELDSNLEKLSKSFNKKGGDSPFSNTGVMVEGAYWSLKTIPSYSGSFEHIGDKLEPLASVPDEFFITDEELNSERGWKYQKGAKKIVRTSSVEHTYTFSEGGLIFPDPLDKASRTIITGEGGKTASRFKHVVLQDGRYRRLMPIELERLNMFPDNHTNLDGITDAKRAFFMGNALVVGIVARLGKSLAESVSENCKQLVNG